MKKRELKTRKKGDEKKKRNQKLKIGLKKESNPNFYYDHALFILEGCSCFFKVHGELVNIYI